MELSRRDFLVLAVSVPIAAHLPSFALASEPRTVLPPVEDELPIRGFAGECSGRY